MDAVISDLLLANQRITREGNWIEPMATLLADLRAREAYWHPSPHERSIAEIVKHMEVWTEWAANFLCGKDTDPEEWPKIVEGDEASWQKHVKDLFTAYEEFELSISRQSADRLSQRPMPNATETTRLQAILSILIHGAYHAGQITKLHERYADMR